MKEHVQDELGLLLAGALEGQDLERVLDHLGECARCTRELALLQEFEESLGTLGRRRRSWLVVAAVAAAACLMLLLLGPDRPERLARTSPLLLADGSQVEALPVARLAALELRRTRLLSGKARFTVVPGAVPFAVETLLGTVQVVGLSSLFRRPPGFIPVVQALPRSNFAVRFGPSVRNLVEMR